MPELPEVETIRRDLERVLLGKEILGVQVRTPRLVRTDPGELVAVLVGKYINRITRRGKLLQFHIAGEDRVMHVHLKMTGQLMCQVPGGLIAGGHPSAKIDHLPNAYTHVVFEFDEETTLFFNDLRTFGYVALLTPAAHEQALAAFGPEPLDEHFTRAHFFDALKGKRAIKAVLLDQTVIAGIGNIYADEICFRARVRPSRRTDTLTAQEKARLYNAMRTIIKKAVEKRGTTFSNFVDATGKKGGYMPYLMVYGRKGERCLRCGSQTITKSVVAGRGTHTCPLCQK